MKKAKKESDDFNHMFDECNLMHKTWHKFSNWTIKNFGKDLHGDWEFIKGVDKNGKKFNFKYRSFNDFELSQRLVGYEVMCKIEKYIKRCCPEIKIVKCDDSVYSSSYLLLIPHPKHGITMMFIPQCTGISNQFFFYEGHYENFIKTLKEMKYVYKNNK
jgi:hypothetical protein